MLRPTAPRKIIATSDANVMCLR